MDYAVVLPLNRMGNGKYKGYGAGCYLLTALGALKENLGSSSTINPGHAVTTRRIHGNS